MQDEVYNEFNESKVHIEEALLEAKSTLDILFPDFRMDDAIPSTSSNISKDIHLPERVIVPLPNGVAIEKNEDNIEILNAMNDSKKLLEANLSKVTDWIKRLTKHGSNAAVMDNLLKLQREMKNELRRCNEIKVVEKRKAVLTTVDNSDDDDDSDDGFETVDLSVKDPEGLGKEIDVADADVNIPKIEKKIIAEPAPEMPKNPLVKRTLQLNGDEDTAGPSKKSAPVLPYGLDLKYWGQDVAPAEIPKNRFDGHRFWRPPDEETVNTESEDVYKTRVITYIGEMPRIKKSCRHPLPSGKLCPRMDRKTCPLHGPIIDRDEQGNPVDMSASSQYQRAHEELQRKKQEAEDDAFLRELEVQTEGKFNYNLAKKIKDRKKRLEGKKREKTPGEALRDRLKNKLLDKRTLRRIGDTLDSIQQAKSREKFAHQWNY